MSHRFSFKVVPALGSCTTAARCALRGSIHVRYIEHHQIPDVKGPIYVISVLENFSRMLLASLISEKQDTAAYLRVLAIALRNYGAPVTACHWP